MEYSNDSPTYRIYNKTNGIIVSSHNVAFIEQVENSTLLPIADDIEDGISSEDLDNLYDGITNAESQDSDKDGLLDRTESKGSGRVSNIETVHQYDRMTLRSKRKVKLNQRRENK